MSATDVVRGIAGARAVLTDSPQIARRDRLRLRKSPLAESKAHLSQAPSAHDRIIWQFWGDETGATALETGFIAAGICHQRARLGSLHHVHVDQRITQAGIQVAPAARG